MALDIDFYLESVVSSAVRVLQIYSRENSESEHELDLDNALVTELSKMAYSQTLNFLNRDIALGNFVDIYPRVSVGEVLRIRNWPVVEVSSVFADGVELVAGEDYILEANRYFQLTASSRSSFTFCEGARSGDYCKDLRITYLGGWEEATERQEVHSGLVAQTVGLYHRKDTLGIGSIKGASFDGSSAAGSMSLSPLDPDAGGLLSAARVSFERYKYLGTAITMDYD